MDSDAKGDPNDPENPGWFFVIQERPGEPRFGLDAKDTEELPQSWDGLAWSHLPDSENVKVIDVSKTPTTSISEDPDAKILWGANAADMAYILYRVPVMVAVHADDILE